MLSKLNYYFGYLALPLLFILSLVENSITLQRQALEWSIGECQRARDSHRRYFEAKWAAAAKQADKCLNCRNFTPAATCSVAPCKYRPIIKTGKESM